MKHVKLLVFLVILAAIFTSIEAAIYSVSQNVQEPATATASPVMRAASDKEIMRGDTAKKQVIFTFDGGGSAEAVDQILAALAKHHVKGTFFLTGKFVEAHSDLVRQMVAAGHEIFSHTYDHPHLTALSDGEIAGELTKMEQSLQATAGVSPKPYFRAPYGDRDGRVIADAFKAGYESVYWTVDARDWMDTKGETDASVEDRILAKASPGTIYLMHLGDRIAGPILDDVFTKLEASGYRIVSLTQGVL